MIIRAHAPEDHSALHNLLIRGFCYGMPQIPKTALAVPKRGTEPARTGR
jgi:hypothetical protein